MAESNFHGRMMNIPTDRRKLMDASTEACDRPRVYEYGHRDARHAAAEIANEADARIAELEAALAAAQERERGHLELLRRLEWLEGEYGPRVCYLCYKQDRQGHTAECEIAAALAAAQPASDGGEGAA